MKFSKKMTIASAVLLVAALVGGFTSCGSKTKSGAAGTDLDGLDPDLASLGDRAGTVDDALLLTVRDVSTSIAPAAVRPDPDLYAKRLLNQYRADGVVMAAEIGATEPFRPLLGGASEDFRTVPQETYDATSLLAEQKVSEEICEALINPNGYNHPGWATILPVEVSSVDTNLLFLAQRFLGKPSSTISADILASLKEIVTTSATGRAVRLSDYVPACVMLSMDAEALLL